MRVYHLRPRALATWAPFALLALVLLAAKLIIGFGWIAGAFGYLGLTGLAAAGLQVWRWARPGGGAPAGRAGYTERLRVPLGWWLSGLAAVVLLSAELVAGFGWATATLGYLGLTGWYAAMLLSWGQATLEVTDGALRAGAARLPLAAAGLVAALDQAQTRAARGPQADPAAFMLIRPYLPEAVYVQVTGEAAVTPYWLIGTRHPGELAAAIERERAGALAGDASVG